MLPKDFGSKENVTSSSFKLGGTLFFLEAELLYCVHNQSLVKIIHKDYKLLFSSFLEMPDGYQGGSYLTQKCFYFLRRHPVTLFLFMRK
jgi:hypothetical protein